MEAPPLRRTVSNEYAPTPPPPPPVFNMKSVTPYSWVKQPIGGALRSAPTRKPEPERPRDFKVIARTQMVNFSRDVATTRCQVVLKRKIYTENLCKSSFHFCDVI